jgi:hypothetical protein
MVYVGDESLVVRADVVRGMNSRPAVVLGDREKLEALSVTLELLYDFNVALRRANRLIVVGYGFADTHINRVIADWMDGDPDRRMCILDPNWIEAPQQSFTGDFKARLRGAMANLDTVGLRGHVIKQGAGEGLCRAIDEWPDNPAARPIEVTIRYEGRHPVVTVSVEMDSRVRSVEIEAAVPDAFQNEPNVVHDFQRKLAAMELPPNGAIETPTLQDLNTFARERDSRIATIVQKFRDGSGVDFAVFPWPSWSQESNDLDLARIFRRGPRSAGTALGSSSES